MIEKIIAWLAGIIITVISATGYFGVVLLMAVESACIPLPSEIIMPFSGALTVPAIALRYHRTAFSLLWVATAGAIGCNLGSVIAYEIGYFGGRPLAEKYGRHIWVTRHDLDMADRFFLRFGSAAVFIGRLLPVIRTFIALPAGIARMNRLRFHVYTFAGSWPWCFALAWAGMRLGEQWESDPRLRLWLHRLDALILLALLAVGIWFVRSHWRDRLQVPATKVPGNLN
jgi:membrane protein DedA with SNARE-associated domain